MMRPRPAHARTPTHSHFCRSPGSDLQHVLNFRTIYGMISDVDLKECYFMQAWGYRDEEFVLANWQKMSIEEMRDAVRSAHKLHDDTTITYPPSKVDVDSLRTKKAILDAYRELTYVPVLVYQGAVNGGFTQRLINRGVLDLGNDPFGAGLFLPFACTAGLDASVIRGLADKCRADKIDDATVTAAMAGHADVLDLLASEFGARIIVDCLAYAARWGHDAMIDHLVEEYGMDPNGADRLGCTALHKAADRGRVRTVKHLVEKHNVDIHKRDGWGEPALKLAERRGRTECADYLRALMSARPPLPDPRPDPDRASGFVLTFVTPRL